MQGLGRAARAALPVLALAGSEQRNLALHAAARSLRANEQVILAANAEDVAEAEASQNGAAMLDRLTLDTARLQSMTAGLEAIAALPDPLGRTIDERERPNGLRIQRVSVPLGVIGIIYESRPNVTADAAALCIKSGNPTILRGGSESLRSNLAIHRCLQEGLDEAGIDRNAIQFVATTDRAAVGFLLSSMAEWIDVVVPRGGKSLIKRVQEEARVPVIGHLEGNCHVYVHSSADVDMACEIAVNAKMRRTGICGAAETLLVDRGIAASALPRLVAALLAADCEIRGDERAVAVDSRVRTATDDDWSTEYLDAIIAMRVVDDIDAAIAHIQKYGSAHTDCIVAADADAAELFLQQVDSAIVLHNASTQFADGGEFGMGAEIGIATGRIHARGPVGAEQLTSYKYIVRGCGQTRA